MTDTTEACPTTAAERLITIRRMQSVIDDDAKVVADLKEGLHDAKETWNVHVTELGDFIRDGSLPLFPDPENPQSEIRNPQSAEPWRTIGLDELDDPAISPAVLARLANAGIETIGEMADKTASDRFDLTHIRGIGAKAAGDIEDVLAAFWVRWDKKQQCEAYHAAIREIPASEIKLPKGKSFFDYYCAAELAEATDKKPAKVKAFEHDGALYTITAGDGGGKPTEGGPKTAEAWKLAVPGGTYIGLTRASGPHPTDPWRGHEGQVVVVNGKERVMTDQVRIVLEEKG